MVKPLEDVMLHIVTQSLGPKTIDRPVVPNGGIDVEHVNHNRDDRLTTRIDNPGHPRRPTAF